jgi:adenine-specific DNA-methyltransferase
MVDYSKLSRDDLIRLLLERDGADGGGIRLTYPGQTPPWQIIRQLKPRSQRIERKLCVGDEASQSQNMLIEGENLQALVSLYKYRGQVDLVLTDPPYNTGLDFRYNDRWDEDPNDPDLGSLVPADDGSRHSKWLRFMTPRLWMMKEMLRPGGILAICIDHREVFRLGMLLDEMFGEANRIGIINWQKSYAPRNDQRRISTATEYVLVYAKNADRSTTALLPRTQAMDKRYLSPDNDPYPWKPGDLTAPGGATHPGMIYAVQSPFTGQIHYPSAGRCWSLEKRRIKAHLEQWGSKYVEKDLGDGLMKALLIKGAPTPTDKDFANSEVLKAAKMAAEKVRKGVWPAAHWRDEGQGTFGLKKYLKDVKQGIVPTTYWSDDDYDTPFVMDSASWDHEHSGHSQSGINELTAIVGRGHGFDTVKPLKLIKKIIQIWCPPSGIVLDPFAGSGTTGHAVMDLNRESGASRRFLLVEQGRPERGDAYARTLTYERLRRVIGGERESKDGKITVSALPLDGGFRFSKLMDQVDAGAVLALEREEMVDLLLTSYWDQKDRSAGHLQRLPAGTHMHLFAKSGRGEGFFLVWNGPKNPSVLNRAAFRAIAAEAEAEGITQPFHVYARISTYSGPNVEFYQIPNKILDVLGFNEAVHPYGVEAPIDIESGENVA